jgi:hypothetical protein
MFRRVPLLRHCAMVEGAVIDEVVASREVWAQLGGDEEGISGSLKILRFLFRSLCVTERHIDHSRPSSSVVVCKHMKDKCSLLGGII